MRDNTPTFFGDAVSKKSAIGRRRIYKEAFNGRNISKKLATLPLFTSHPSHVLTQVHHKVKGKEALAAQLDAKLREVGRDVGVRFGGRELTHSFLAESCLHCCKVPHCSTHSPLAEMLHSSYIGPAGKPRPAR